MELIPAAFYNTVFLVIVTILTIIVSVQYSHYGNKRLGEHVKSSHMAAFLVATGFALYIGCRPVSGVFIDMMNYVPYYARLTKRHFEFTIDTNNIIFDNILPYLAANKIDIRFFYLINAFVYFGGMFIAFKKMLPKDTLYMLVIYLGAFSTFSYGTNGFKAGAAASLFLCALAYRDNIRYLILFCLLSFGFHHSMTLPIGALVLSLLYKNTKVYYYVWIACVLLAALHVTYFQTIFNGISDEQGQAYLSNIDGEASHGFRIDFIIYSAFPAMVGYYAVFKHGYRSVMYQMLLNTYLLVNSIWMLCMYASFTNRIAFLSWLILPVVLVYPFFDKEFVPRQYNKLNLVAWGHLGFTLAMQIIYYGFIK